MEIFCNTSIVIGLKCLFLTVWQQRKRRKKFKSSTLTVYEIAVLMVLKFFGQPHNWIGGISLDCIHFFRCLSSSVADIPKRLLNKRRSMHGSCLAKCLLLKMKVEYSSPSEKQLRACKPWT